MHGLQSQTMWFNPCICIVISSQLLNIFVFEFPRLINGYNSTYLKGLL